MKVLISQLNYTVGDLEGNYRKISDVLEKHGNIADLIVFSELCVSGYYPMDMLNNHLFVEDQLKIVDRIRSKTKDISAAVVIGYISKNEGFGKKYFNSLSVFLNSVEIFKYHKKLLPTYNIFDEDRYFEPGDLQPCFNYKNKNIGVLICEDGWADASGKEYDNVPAEAIVKNPVDLVISINGSPASIGKRQQRMEVFSSLVKKYDFPLIYTNQVGGNDELIFDGSSFVLDRKGDIVGELQRYSEDEKYFSFENKDEIRLLDEVASLPISDENSEHEKNKMIMPHVLIGLRDYVVKCGFSKVVIGSSGGIDSAVTIAIAAMALGGENVTAITMPGPYSSSGSVEDSVVLCEKFGVKLYNMSIREEYELAVSEFEKTFETKAGGITKENIQARIRGRKLMEYSNNFGHLVLSTGNKSEMSVGYATLYGDMNGGLNLLGDLYKMEVYSLARFINEVKGEEYIPQAIIEKEPSAELSEDQRDSDSLPPYPILDAILRLYIEDEYLTDYEREADLKTISQVGEEIIDKVIKMVDRAEFKRRQAPPIVRIHKKAFGVGRRRPIAQRYLARIG